MGTMAHGGGGGTKKLAVTMDSLSRGGATPKDISGVLEPPPPTASPDHLTVHQAMTRAKPSPWARATTLFFNFQA